MLPADVSAAGLSRVRQPGIWYRRLFWGVMFFGTLVFMLCAWFLSKSAARQYDMSIVHEEVMHPDITLANSNLLRASMVTLLNQIDEDNRSKRQSQGIQCNPGFTPMNQVSTKCIHVGQNPMLNAQAYVYCAKMGAVLLYYGEEEEEFLEKYDTSRRHAWINGYRHRQSDAPRDFRDIYGTPLNIGRFMEQMSLRDANYQMCLAYFYDGSAGYLSDANCGNRARPACQQIVTRSDFGQVMIIETNSQSSSTTHSHSAIQDTLVQ